MESIMTPSLLFDLICLVVVLLAAARFAKKGLLATVVECVGTLGSLIAAKIFSGWAALQIFESWFAAGLREKLILSIEQSGSVDLQSIVSNLAGFLPESMIQSVIEPIRGQLEAALATNSEVMADTLMTKLIQPLLVPVIVAILFFLSFILLRICVGVVVHMLTHVNGIPFVGAANKGLGFLAGSVVGILYLFLLLCAVWILVAVTGGQLPYLNNATLAHSFCYNIFVAINPFVA